MTVAALDQARNEFRFDESKLTVGYFKAPGKGGQKKNKTENACRLQYDDFIVTCSDERSKRQNYESAMKVLKERLTERHRSAAHNQQNAVRQAQIGTGQRGDKIRTYRSQDDVVTDHRTGHKMQLSAILRGRWFNE